jgi:hypothetical protein
MAIFNSHVKLPEGKPHQKTQFFSDPAKTTGPPFVTNSEVSGAFGRRRSAKPEIQVLGGAEGYLFSNFQWIGFVGKILTGNHGFYHEINGFSG